MYLPESVKCNPNKFHSIKRISKTRSNCSFVKDLMKVYNKENIHDDRLFSKNLEHGNGKDPSNKIHILFCIHFSDSLTKSFL